MAAADLRTALEEMTHDGTDIETYPAKLLEMANVFPHTIRQLQAPFDEPLGEFNCVMYALCLTARLEHSCSPLGRFYADTAFLDRLIEGKHLIPCLQKTGAIVVWRSEGRTKHVGVVAEIGRANSKWGIGFLFEHGLFEVPLGYGSDVVFYESIDAEQALSLL